MGLSDSTATSLLWPNSARTTIDIELAESDKQQGIQVSFASEANKLEFFMFSSGK